MSQGHYRGKQIIPSVLSAPLTALVGSRSDTILLLKFTTTGKPIAIRIVQIFHVSRRSPENEPHKPRTAWLLFSRFQTIFIDYKTSSAEPPFAQLIHYVAQYNSKFQNWHGLRRVLRSYDGFVDRVLLHFKIQLYL